jgi:DNA-binding transcriptional LysR family regulator
MDLLALRAFVRTVEDGSLTSAGLRIGLTVSGVAKAVNRLEDHLGVRLLIRTTRHVSPTPEGQEFYERCRAILAELDDAEQSMTEGQGTPKGDLSIDLPLLFARRYLLPDVPEFLKQYPEINLSLSFGSGSANLAQDGLDAVIQIGEPTNQQLVRRTLVIPHHCLCASPEYIKAHGRPLQPNDLRGHRCLIRPSKEREPSWVFVDSGKIIDIKVSGQLYSTRGDALVDMAVAGLGFVYLYDYFVADAVENGKLQVCLPEYAVAAPPVVMCYLRSRHLPRKTRAFLDFAKAAVARRQLASVQRQRPSG